MDEKPRLAKSYEITDREIRVDGELFPYYVHEDGPRIEPAFDGELTTLWVPILIDKPCPQLGAPEGTTTPCTDHRPVQHRDAKPPWCNTCGHTADGLKPHAHWDIGADGRVTSPRDENSPMHLHYPGSDTPTTRKG